MIDYFPTSPHISGRTPTSPRSTAKRVSYAATPSKLMRRTCAPNCKLHRPIFLILLLLVS
jgi:hypothetical protein